MAIQHLLTNVKFTTLQWSDVLRCAVRSGHDFRGANVDVDQLESRVLFSASPLPVEVVEVAEVDESDTAESSSATGQDGSQSAGSDTTTDDIRTSDDTLALLDELSYELLPTLADEKPTNPTLLQFTTNGGNILGFTQDSILVASSSNLFDVRFVGANLVGPVAAESTSDATDVAASTPVGAAAFTSVSYAGLWNGVTAVFDSQEGAILKSTYYVDAGLGGGAVDQIRLQYNRDVSLDAQGNLVISYDTGTMTDSAPVAWQDIDGQRIFIDVHYALLGDNQVGFTVGDYDHNYQLVIDPTLTWNTFLGGSGADYAQSIAVDSSGNVYVAGYSTATWGSPVRAFGGGGQDGFVAKLSSSGSLTWNTFLGGGGTDSAYGVVADVSGNVYVTGASAATWGSPLQAFAGGSDAYVAKLNSSGSLTWSTFLGGAGNDTGADIAVDSSGNVYITGDSSANWGSPLRAYTSGSDAFAAKLTSSGSLSWNTFLGGSGSEYGTGITVDTSGNVYLSGYGDATWGAPARAYSGGFDGFAVKLSSSGGLTWNTFLGGSGYDIAKDIAVDSSGNVYVAGMSGSSWGSPVQSYGGGSYDQFAAKVSSSGALTWNTFLGGSGTDSGNGIAVDSAGIVYIVGSSSATWGSPLSGYSGGSSDASLVQLNNNGSLLALAFLGSAGSDSATAIALDNLGYAYFAGYGDASWGSPVRSFSSGTDSFATKTAVNAAPTLDASKGPALNAQDEDPGAPTGAVGTLVSQLVDFATPSGQVDNVSDSDSGALLGIAVTNANSTNGSWYYSINNGTTWIALGAISNSSARLLAADANTRLIFQPNTNYNGTISDAITFRAWDQSSGANGALADTSSNGGATAFSTATDTASLTINAVNDAPVNTVPTAQLTSKNTVIVFSAANGNQIAISDVDAGGTAMQVTMTATNGTITLAGTTGLSFSVGNGTANATMTFTGAIANINAALNGVSFTPTTSYTGSATLQIVTSDQGNTGSGGALSDTDVISISVTDASFWVSTTGNSTSSVGSGNLSWTDGAVVNFGNPNLALGSGTTTGTFSNVFDIDTFAGSNENINGLHYVSRNVTVGTVNPISLQPGDVLFTLSANTNIGGLSITKSDVVLFRPTAVGNYSSGTFSFLLRNPGGTGNDVRDFALVETAVTIGGTSLQAGDFLMVLSSSTYDRDVSLFRPTTMSTNPTGGTLTKFIDSSSAGIGTGGVQMRGLELIQQSTTIGGQTLSAGQLVITLTGSASVGTNSLSVAVDDLYVLNVTATGTGTSSATASMLFRGSNVGLTGGSETLDALALVLRASAAPVVTLSGGGLSYTENDPATVIDATASITDSDSTNFGTGTLTAYFSANGTVNDRLAIRNQGTGGGQIGVSGFNVTYAGILIGTFSGGDDGSTPLAISLNANATVAATQALLRNITYQNVSDNPSTLARTLTVLLNDGGGGSSNLTNKTISVTAVNDEQVLSTNTGMTVLEGSTGNVITSVMLATTDLDNAGAQLVYTLTGAPANGTLRRNGINLSMSSTFTQADIDAGIVTYLHNDSETTSDSFSFTVDDGVGTTSSGTFNITVTPVNDNAPIITSNGGGATANINVAENSTAVTTVTATDADLPGQTIAYSIIGGADSALFSIDTSTGVLTFVSARDRESPTDANLDGIYEVIVQASDGLLVDTQTINVTVTDVNEFAVSSPIDANPASNSVDENAVTGTSVGITASAFDADGTTNTVTYSLDDDAGGLFTIHATTGVVTVNGALDYETATSHNITARATSSDGSFSTQLFTINVTDVNESSVSAISDSDAAGDFVLENVSVGTVVGVTALATDADGTDTVSYSLDDDAGGLFAIDSTTGVVTVNGAIDREAASSYNITVRATSTDTSTITQVFNIAIGDVDEYDVGAVSDSNAAANTVAENATIGTTVGITVSAQDLDATNNTITYTLDDDAGGLFTIHATTGVVTVNGALDYETATSHNITARATSSDGSFNTQSFTINVTDVNESGVSAISDSDAAADFVLENVSVGSVVGVTALATDADGTDSVSYSLDDDAGGLFAIDSTTGVVTVNGAIDREASSSYNITVRATSTDTSTTTQVFNIAIGDIDEYDVGAVSDSNAAANTVAENATIGTTVGITVSAQDLDATNNTITYTLDDDAGGLFTIHATTGVVTVNGALDYETATSHNITARATSSDGSFNTQAFTINVTDVNESSVSAISDSDAAADFVLENVSVGSVVGVTALATDADGTDTVSYSLDNDAGGLFAIDSTTGVVTVNGAIDREAASSYNITVRATSTDTSTTTQVFNIAIGDVDEYDVGAVSDSNAAANTVAENATIGTTVGVTVSAQDLDATNNTITYTLDDDAGGLFTIHATTGVVTVNGALDYETATSHNITARATSSDGSFNTQSFTINVTDVNESGVSAISDSDAAADFVLENVSVGTVVGVTALATDADGTDSVSYSLDDDAGGLFAIDSTTGVVTVNGAIDRELAGSYNITVRATSTDTSTTTQVFSIAIGDVDEYDVGAVSDSNATANTVAEDATIGTAVGITVAASDADATNNTITYTLDDDAGGLFTIHATTGVVTVNGALDYETATSHNITARATSSDGSSNTQVFTINVTDFNEFSVGAISDSDGAVNAVAEDAANGVVVGLTALASDADGTNNSITYSLDDSASGRFAIDSSTGIVTLADSSLLDFETSASHNITVRASSSDGSFQTQVFTISVIDRNDAPIITSNGGGSVAFVNAAEGSLVATTVVAQDADLPGDVLTFSIIGGADAGRFEIDSSSGQLRFKVAPNYEVPHDANGDGIHDVIVRVSDGRGGMDEQTIRVTVTNVNDAPIAGADGDFQTDQLSKLTVSSPSLLANDSDEDGDPLTAVLVTNAQHGSLTLNADGSFVYTPNAGFSGTDQFQYAASDGNMLSAPVTINITVALVAPSAPASPPIKSSSDVEKSSPDDSQDKPQPKAIATVAPSIAAVPAAVATDAPVGVPSSALGIASLPAEPAASRDKSERTDQPEQPDLSFAINVLEDALRSTTRKLAESAARPIHYTSFGLIADTVLTLAFDSSDGSGDGLAWQKELQARQLIVGTAAAVTSSLSVGYVVWMLRGGTMVASFMSSIPAWCSFDPLPIVDSFENAHTNKGRSPVDESLASIAGPRSSTTTTDS